MKRKCGRILKGALSFALTGAMVLGAVPMPFGAGSIETFADDDGVFTTWYDIGGNIQVDTGLGNGTNTEGIWYVMTDEEAGGKSRIDWDCDEPDENGSIINGNIENGSLSGTAVLDKGKLSYNPYVYICFDVVGLGENSKPVPGDASGWGGLSISYSCDAAPSLELGLGDDVDANIEFANPAVALAKSTTGSAHKLAWSDFKQPSWYKGTTKISGPDAAKQLVSVRFKIEAKSGSYHFRIHGIGNYDAQLSVPDSNIYGPTPTPSATPTAEPTATPKATPTAEPTATPPATSTAEPTLAPTVVPTTSPSSTPTVEPTATPTVTPKQTVKKPKAPTLNSVKNEKSRKITINWSKVKGVKGYEVQYALDKDFTKTLKTKSLTNTSLTVQKLKKKKTYYVRVRSYVKDSDNKKVYSKWSKTKKVKIKK